MYFSNEVLPGNGNDARIIITIGTNFYFDEFMLRQFIKKNSNHILFCVKLLDDPVYRMAIQLNEVAEYFSFEQSLKNFVPGIQRLNQEIIADIF